VHREVARPGARVTVRRGYEPVAEIASYAEVPPVQPRPRITTVGERRLRVGLLLPTDHRPGTSLPVLMDPYGGPHGPRVAARSDRWLTSQWLADQGFAVVVADGRGTGRRGPAWDRAVSRHLDDVPLQDQVDALLAVAAEEPDLDLSRVGIRGWSFGGYLAALAVLRRPDVFHAAVAGAPVVDWRLYDTAYTER
jgi:dipeptidyl-peptidase-4